MAINPGSIPCICFYARRAARSLTQVFDRHLRPTGLNAAQYGMLRSVSTLEEPSLAEIGKLMCMEQSTVSRNIEALINKGLALTIKHQDDPRKKIVQLTDEGKNRLAGAQAAWEKAQNEIKDKLGEADFQALFQLLNRIN